LATWNLRWFPDGGPGKDERPGRDTDIEWLACTIAFMGVDLVAVQEIKTHARGRASMARLLELLDRHTRGKWRHELDPCPLPMSQHVGFVYDTSRASARAFRTLERVNAYGEACKNQLRPALSGHFEFSNGFDAHVVVVHLKSGTKRHELELRRTAMAALGEELVLLREASGDSDVILLGDFNTMGCAHCSPKIADAAELAVLDAELAGLGVPLRRVSQGQSQRGPNAGCSHYYRGRAGLLDHIALSLSLAQASLAARSWSEGLCGVRACGALPKAARPAAYERLSDHCPVVVEIGRDLKPAR
jgi:endonuclease/exonuclease/phosphatase family metal-dependent hydrolase